MNQSRKRSRRSGAPQLEDVPELIHLIQSRLPVKDAALTSVLSKSWLQAWSTIPALRFCYGPVFSRKQRKPLKLDDIDRTVMRYARDNIPIETFELSIEIENQESASLAENWLRLLATKTRVKELSLTTVFSCDASVNLTHEILLSETLTKLRVIAGSHSVWMRSSQQPVIIKCLSLRELHLNGLRISQEILAGMLSSCSSLEKIDLSYCTQDLNNIKVINLPCLNELNIVTDDEDNTDFVIGHLPNIRSFYFHLLVRPFGHPNPRPLNALSISLGSRVTELALAGVIRDNACLGMIKSWGFPCLERLTLGMTDWMLGSFHFTCASIKRLSLKSCPTTLIDVQVHAPKLLYFEFEGETLPSFLFPVSTLKQILLLCW